MSGLAGGRSRSNTNPFLNDNATLAPAVGAANANPFVNSSAAAAPSSPLGPPDIEPDVGVISLEPTELELGGESDGGGGSNGDGGSNDGGAVDAGNVFAFAETGKPLAATHVAAFSYTALELDECALTGGDMVHVAEEGMDGWYVGKNLTTNQLGTFPGNFVVTFEAAQKGGLLGPAATANAGAGAAVVTGSVNAAVATSVGLGPAGVPGTRDEGTREAVALVDQLTSDEDFARRLQLEEDEALATQMNGPGTGTATQMNVPGTGPAVPVSTRPPQQQQRRQRPAVQVQAQPPRIQAVQPPIAVRKTPVVIPSRISKKQAKKGRRSIVMGSEDEDYEQFVLRFLGSQRVLEPRTDGVINQTIQKVIASRKQMKISTASLFDLHVFAKGIQLIDMGTTKKKKSSSIKKAAAAAHRTGGPVTEYALQNICKCEYDRKDPRLFGFISVHNSNQDPAYACHVFMYDKSTVPIINAIARAFEQYGH